MHNFATSRECYSLSDNPRVISLNLPMEWRDAPRSGRTASGYGQRLPTCQVCNVDGRMHRVYCRLFSNIGTCFIVVRGFTFYVNN